jgi:hypothetical protein
MAVLYRRSHGNGAAGDTGAGNTAAGDAMDRALRRKLIRGLFVRLGAKRVLVEKFVMLSQRRACLTWAISDRTLAYFTPRYGKLRYRNREAFLS